MNTNEIIVILSVKEFEAIDTNGVNHWDSIPVLVRQRAMEVMSGKGSIIYNPNCEEWQRIEVSKIGEKIDKIKLTASTTDAKPKAPKVTKEVKKADLDEATKDVINFVHSAPEFKPNDLIMADVKWKYLIRNIMRGQNIMMVGDSGMGKTVAAIAAARSLERPLYIIGMGSTQDPRATLIGNTQFNKDSGTFFAESRFVNAIQEENAVIILDELSRANGEAWNICCKK